MPRRRKQDQLSDFGRAIEMWRKENGVSQRALAALCGTHQRTLSNWMKVDGLPAVVFKVVRLAAIVGRPLPELLNRDAEVPGLADSLDMGKKSESGASSAQPEARALAYLELPGRADHPDARADPIHALSDETVDYRCAARGYRGLCTRGALLLRATE